MPSGSGTGSRWGSSTAKASSGSAARSSLSLAMLACGRFTLIARDVTASALADQRFRQRVARQVDGEDAALGGHVAHAQTPAARLDRAARYHEPQSEAGAVGVVLHE